MEPVHLKDHPLAHEVITQLEDGSLTIGSPIEPTVWTADDQERLIKACTKVAQLREGSERRGLP